ncbi:MAG TPA: hydantoinase/oxoprolinase family protein [Solirubrobacterales bacterium]|nr:hydantoinase/oxoprolinase family protein [Solirubrobacterales bacterium]
MSTYRVSVDIGGTFTDCTVVAEDGTVTIGKSPSTPPAFATGFVNAVGAAAEALGMPLEALLAATSRLSHGTTVGINAVVSRTGARVGLLATVGHGDALRILNNTGRTNGQPVERILDYAASSLPERFVRREDVVEVMERIDSFGEVVVPLDRDGVLAGAERLLDQGVETLAVSYLWSHANRAHEEATRELLAAHHPDLFVSCGAELAQRIGEYPRTATAVLNSYIGPLMRDYVTTLLEELRAHGYRDRLLFAQCDGGLIDAEEVIARPVMTLESGPVGGVVACARAGAERGQENIIAADMGGTTFDVSVISEGRLPIRDGVVVEQHDLFLRMVDVESVGAGGGSLAWVDPQSGALRVGPQSAGALPGPVCYGRGGTVPTVTDADLVLGLFNPDNFLGGRMTLDIEAARAAVGGLGEQLGLGLLECAAGIQEVADSLMEDKIRSMTVARGHDPRDFTLYAFGGGGAVHAGLFSRGLGIRRVVVPVGDLASVWSAYGIGLEGYGRTYELPAYMRAPFDLATIAAGFETLEAAAREDAARSGIAWDALVTARTADVKYALQVYDVEAEVPSGTLAPGVEAAIVDNFERNYAHRFGEGVGYPEGGVDMTALRLHVEPAESFAATAGSEATGAATATPAGEREVFWPELGEPAATPVYAGNALPGGTRLTGPALLDFPDTTVVLRPAVDLVVEPGGNLTMEMED